MTLNVTQTGSSTVIIYYKIMPQDATNQNVQVDQSPEVAAKVVSLKVDKEKQQVIITFSTPPISGYISITSADNKNLIAIVDFTNHNPGDIEPIL